MMIDMATALATVLLMQVAAPVTPPAADPPRDAYPDGYEPPVPIGGEISWLSPISNYPPEARRRREEGRVIIQLSVSAKGVPSACTILSSSGSFILDKVTCDGARKYGRFRPATQFGRPIASTYEPRPVNWKLDNPRNVVTSRSGVR